MPTTTLCCQRLMNGNICGAPFCPSCLFERSHGVASNSHLQQVSKLVCHVHYVRFVKFTEERQKEVTIKYKSELNVFHALGNKMSNDPATIKRTEHIVEKTDPSCNTHPERVASYESGSLPLAKQSVSNDVTSKGGIGNECRSIITECHFDFCKW